MPFDSTPWPEVIVPVKLPFNFETATPDDRMLEGVRILRHNEEWEGKIMLWNYSTVLDKTRAHPCGSVGCAMGLFHLLWGDLFFRDAQIKQALGLNDEQVHRIFYGGSLTYQEYTTVRPHHVAAVMLEIVRKRNPGAYRAWMEEQRRARART